MTKVFIIILFLIGLTGCFPNEEFLVTTDFEGVVVVVYGDPLGVVANGVYHIPESGKLFVKDPPSDASKFSIYEKLNGGDRNKLVSAGVKPGSRRYLRFLGIGGKRTSSTCNAGPAIPLATFVVTSSEAKGLWRTLQESKVEEAATESLRHRGVDEKVIDCYRSSKGKLPFDEQFPENWKPER